MASRLVFAVNSLLGYRVVLDRNRWRQTVRFKHPALAGKENSVRRCLIDPEVIRASVQDPNVHLYYRAYDGGRACVVVAGQGRRERFVVTAYFTQEVKKGRELRTR